MQGLAWTTTGRRHLRWKRVFRGFVVLALLGCVHLYFLVSILFSPYRLRQTLESELRRRLHTKVEITSLEMDFPSSIHIGGVRSVSRQEAGARPSFKASDIRVQVDPWSLLHGQLDIRTIEISRPELVLDLSSLAEQTAPFSGSGDESSSAGRMFHEVSIENAAVSLLHVPGFGADEAVRIEGISAGISRIAGLHRGLRITGDISNDWLAVCDYRLDIDERATAIRGDVHAERVRVSPELFARLPLAVRELLAPYDPKGEFNFDFGFRLNWKTGQAEELSVRAELVDCQARHDQLPWPVTGISGKIQTDGKNLNVRDVVATVGPASVRLSGHRLLDPARTQVEETWNVSVEGLSFDETVRSQLRDEDAALRLWDQLNPTGHVSAEVRLGRREDGKFAVTADFQSRDLRVTHHRFAYPARILSGRIDWDGTTCRLQDIELRAGESRAVLNGETGSTRRSPKRFHYKFANAVLDETFRQALEEQSRRVWDELSPSGTLSGEYEAASDRDGRWSFLVKATGGQATMRYAHFPLPVELVSGSVAWNRDILTFKDVQVRNGKTLFKIDGQCHSMKPVEGDLVTIVSEGLPLEQHVRDALRHGTGAVWDELQPAGEVSARMELYGQETGKWRYGMSLTGGEARMCYRKFPYPVQVAQCSAEWDDTSVRILKTECKSGSASVVVTGEVPRDKEQESTFRLDFKSVPVDWRIRDALPEGVRQTWDQFAFAGPVDGSLEIANTEQAGTRYGIHLQSEEATVAWRKIPVPVQFSLMHLVWDKEAFQVKQVLGKASKGDVQVSGSVPLSPGRTATVSITGANLELTPALRDAFPAAVQSVWKDFQFKGTADVESQISWETGETVEPAFRVTVGCKSVSACWKQFPAALSQLAGKIIVANDNVKVTKLQGVHGDCPITIDGTVAWPGGKPVPDLTIRVEQVALDKELLGLLPAIHEPLWKELKPTGMAEAIECRLRARPDGELDYQFTARFSDVGITYSKLPVPLKGLKGLCIWKDGSMKIEELKGSVLNGSFEAAGQAKPEGLDLTFTATGLKFGPDVFRFMPKAVQEQCQSIDPKGDFGVSANVKCGWDAEKTQSSFEAEMKLADVEARLGLPFSHIRGILRLTGTVLGEQLTHLEGTAELATAQTRGHLLEGLTATVAWADQLLVKELRATYHGGLVRADIKRDQKADMTEVKLSFSDVNIADFAESFGSESKISGKLRGGATFNLKGGDIGTLQGTGRAYIDGEDLWRLPSLDAITGILKAGEKNRVSQLEMEYAFNGPKLEIGFLRLVGSEYNIYGDGTVTFDWELDLTLFVASRSFLTRFANLVPVGPLKLVGNLFEKIQASLMQLEMKGPAKTARPASVPLKSSLPDRVLEEMRKDGKKL